MESLLAEIEALPDPPVRNKVAEILQALLALYGAGLARMLEISAGPERAPAALLQAFAADELIAHLLMLHDLHPETVEARVARALAEVRPYLQSHGGSVELLGVGDSLVRVRLEGSCRSCPSSAETLRSTVEEAIRLHAPEVTGIVVDDPLPEPPRGFGPASSLLIEPAVAHV